MTLLIIFFVMNMGMPDEHMLYQFKFMETMNECQAELILIDIVQDDMKKHNPEILKEERAFGVCHPIDIPMNVVPGLKPGEIMI
jgi:hypothetical protein